MKHSMLVNVNALKKLIEDLEMMLDAIDNQGAEYIEDCGSSLGSYLKCDPHIDNIDIDDEVFVEYVRQAKAKIVKEHFSDITKYFAEFCREDLIAIKNRIKEIL